jgi:DNA-binding transcriptional regulator YdaS (Cro superfamily)
MTQRPNFQETVSALRAAADCFGGSESKLAAAAGFSQNALWHARQVGRVSGDLAAAIDRATNGRIPARRFRPDIFDLNGASTPSPGDSNGHAAGSCGGPNFQTPESPSLAAGDVDRAAPAEASG